MGSRQLSRLVALLSVCALAAGCASRRADQGAREGSEPTAPAVHTGAGETRGLVGTDVNVEAIEVTDEGPPAPVVLFTSGIKGYTEPCGCTLDLVLGGIDRVTGTVRAAAALAPAHLVLDAGNTLFEHPTIDPQRWAQEVRKSRVIVAALGAMGTAATVPGRTDFAAGVGFYHEALAESGIRVLAANLSLAADRTLLGEPSATFELGSERVGVIGAVDPARFADLTEVVTTSPADAVQQQADALVAAGATTVIVLFQGDLAAARTQLGEVSGVDFIIIGADPRQTDEVEQVGAAVTLEAYDQGRNVGRLKLHRPDGATGHWQNALRGSDGDRERLERVIAGVEAQLAELPPSDGGEPPPIAVRLQERVAGLRDELARIQDVEPVFDADAPRFLYRPIPMYPGYPTEPSITDAMREYNQALREINLASAAPPPPPAPGMPHYVGTERCVTCHVEAGRVWQNTAHSGAWQTLVERDKQFDRSCISCHVTGYERPGGSSLGHTDGLVDVQCEQCHGAGSMHAEDPSLMGFPQGVVLGDTVETCTGCHNEEHSPRFDHATYLPRVLGPGHGLDP